MRIRIRKVTDILEWSREMATRSVVGHTTTIGEGRSISARADTTNVAGIAWMPGRDVGAGEVNIPVVVSSSRTALIPIASTPGTIHTISLPDQLRNPGLAIKLLAGQLFQ
jgi:hypothetical protein